MKKPCWSYLKKGDLVDIVAPGMKPLPGVMDQAQEFLRSWGLKGRLPNHGVKPDLICSAPRKARSQDLKKALLSKDSKMVWCVRGGYGSLHLLEDLASWPKGPAKIFLGLSDITSLHLFLNQSWNWPTLHGCNLDRFVRGEDQRGEASSLKKLLFGKTDKVTYSLKPLNDSARTVRKWQGSIVGGNLITLQSSLGTPFEIKTRGKILFVEDIGERAYKLDRVFTHLYLSGGLRGLKAVVFGQFTGSEEPGGPSLVSKWMKEWAQTSRVPVFSGLPSGHGPKQRPLPLNTSAHIFGGMRSKIEIHSGGRR